MSFNFSYLKQVALLALVGSAYATPALKPQTTTFQSTDTSPVITATASSFNPGGPIESASTTIETATFDPSSAFPSATEIVTVTEIVYADCSSAPGIVSSFTSVAPTIIPSSIASGTIVSSFTTAPVQVSSIVSEPSPNVTVSSFPTTTVTATAEGNVTSIIGSAAPSLITIVTAAPSFTITVVTALPTP